MGPHQSSTNRRVRYRGTPRSSRVRHEMKLFRLRPPSRSCLVSLVAPSDFHLPLVSSTIVFVSVSYLLHVFGSAATCNCSWNRIAMPPSGKSTPRELQRSSSCVGKRPSPHDPSAKWSPGSIIEMVPKPQNFSRGDGQRRAQVSKKRCMIIFGQVHP